MIEIDRNGRVVQLVDTRVADGKRLVARTFLVPKGEKKTFGVKSNLLWDSAEYVIGIDRARKSGGASPTAAFRARIEALPEPARRDPGVEAVLRALDAGDWQVIQQHSAWATIEADNPVMTFALASDDGRLVCQRPAVVDAARAADAEGVSGRCLVEGIDAPIARLHPAIKGVRGSQPTGANIVSFNERAFESYGKRERQGENAPIGERAAFAYTTALNALLERDSPNRVQIGDASTLIWADRDTDLDAELAALFGDDPDAGVEHVRQRLEAVRTGKTGAADAETRFFILGLAPNVARLAVRFFVHAPFAEIGPRILRHFDDLRIVRQSDADPATPSMFRLLCTLAPQGKVDNLSPTLAGDWMRAILEDLPYPPALLIAAVNRCRAEQATRQFGGNVPYLRAAILKSCINRDHRRRRGLPGDHQLIREELDMDQTDTAYRLGRLFATLERVQSRAQPGINTTIRDRYYGAASSTPAAVFPTLLRLEKAHLKKLGSGEAAWFERLIGEICGSTDEPLLASFPSHLDIRAQGLFALGYYHQRQSFFARSEANDAIPTEAATATEEQ